MSTYTKPTFFLTRIPRNTRIFLSVNISAIYIFILYLIHDTSFLDFSQTQNILYMSFSMIPIIIGVIPEILYGKNFKKTDNITESIEKDEIDSNLSESEFMQSDSKSSDTISVNSPPGAVPVSVSDIIMKNENLQSTEEFVSELATIKKSLEIRDGEISEMKESMTSLQNIVETGLTELKSANEEIRNPLGVLSKQKDKLELDNLDGKKVQTESSSVVISESIIKPSEAKPDSSIVSEIKPDLGHIEFKSTLKENEPVLCMKLGLGQFMEILLKVGDKLKNADPSDLSKFIDECKVLGIPEHQESVIYGMATLLSGTKVSTKDIISIIYQFAKISGTNDPKADLIFAQLQMTQNKGG